MFTASSILFYHLLVFFLSYQSILLYTWLLLTPCPATILSFGYPADLLYLSPDASNLPNSETHVFLHFRNKFGIFYHNNCFHRL